MLNVNTSGLSWKRTAFIPVHEVDDDDACHVIKLQEREIGRHGDVAEDSKALSSIIGGMVCVSHEVGRHMHLAATHAAHRGHRATH